MSVGSLKSISKKKKIESTEKKGSRKFYGSKYFSKKNLSMEMKGKIF